MHLLYLQNKRKPHRVSNFINMIQICEQEQTATPADELMSIYMNMTRSEYIIIEYTKFVQCTQKYCGEH